MNRARSVARSGSWPEELACCTVTLAFDDRYRRRIRLITDNGKPFLLDLDHVCILNSGDGLKLDEGRWIKVLAAKESVAELRSRNPHELTRLAWHLGNRHVPIQLLSDGLRFRDDPVLIEMMRGLGGSVERKIAVFDPEPGAYHHHFPA